jgi:LexA-binding, inner membrane-associated putative hydrolase
MFSKWLPLFLQLCCGWDTITGLGAFVLLSLAFDEPAIFWVLMVGGFCAYLPDLDFIPYLLLRKRLHLVGHWVLGHYPPIVLPLVAASAWVATLVMWPGHAVFIVLLATICTAGHFVHDSGAKRGGFHLLAPFTPDWRIRFTLHKPEIWAHYRIHCWGIKLQSSEDVQSIYDANRARSQAGGSAREVIGRVELVTRTQFVVFGICIAGLALLIARNGYRMPF